MNEQLNVAVEMLAARGIAVEEMAALVRELQLPYNPQLSHAVCHESVAGVLRKREVQYAIITGVTIDQMAEAGTLDEPLQSIVREDHRLFAVDNALALFIVNLYGSIGLSNFGYLLEERPGCLARIGARPGRVDTFLDSLVAAVVAAACARIAHNSQTESLGSEAR